jgi:hypothetical protein
MRLQNFIYCINRTFALGYIHPCTVNGILGTDILNLRTLTEIMRYNKAVNEILNKII